MAAPVPVLFRAEKSLLGNIEPIVKQRVGRVLYFITRSPTSDVTGNPKCSRCLSNRCCGQGPVLVAGRLPAADKMVRMQSKSLCTSQSPR